MPSALNRAVVARLLLLPNETLPGPLVCVHAGDPVELAASNSVSLVLLRKTVATVGLVMVTEIGASQTRLSVTFVPALVPTAWTWFEPAARVTGQRKML